MTLRAYNFHRHTLQALAEMLAAAGLEHPTRLDARHLVRRISASEIKLFAQQHRYLKPGELLGEQIEDQRMWKMARADSFDAAP